jgi:hypothetical protein
VRILVVVIGCVLIGLAIAASESMPKGLAKYFVAALGGAILGIVLIYVAGGRGGK